MSGSTPPLAFVFPWVLGIFMMIYGASALLIREATIRWKTGPAGVISLGLAFGILNEGMAAHSLFNPSWPDLGRLAGFGYYGGVNWIWTEWIVPFHAVWSMAFPILLVRQFWPDIRDRPLVSLRWLALVVPIPFLGAAITTAWFIGYPPTLVEWMGMGGALLLLVFLTYHYVPRLRSWRPLGNYVPTPRTAAVVGVLFFLVGQVGIFSTAGLGLSAAVVFLLVVLLFGAFALFGTAFRDDRSGERARFAWTIGGTGFYVALSPFSEFFLGRAGLVPIDVAFLAFVVWLYRQRAAGPEGLAGVPPAGATGEPGAPVGST
ncbi:MAG TPA: hypothetical protein VK424_02210 [Thermoplasmata archaeon]|nr:hypothetical protein [Thermoplasmata archaeon]